MIFWKNVMFKVYLFKEGRGLLGTVKVHPCLGFTLYVNSLTFFHIDYELFFKGITLTVCRTKSFLYNHQNIFWQGYSEIRMFLILVNKFNNTSSFVLESTVSETYNNIKI